MILIFSFSFSKVYAKQFTNYFGDFIYVEHFTEDNIEYYDLYDLLSYDESIAFINWLEECYKFNLNKEKDHEFVINNFSKFVLLAMQKNIVKNYYSDSDFTVMWSSKEHDNFALHTISDMLPNDGKDSVYDFYFPYISTLRQYSKEPDLDESIGGTHYYVYEGTLSTNGGYYRNANNHYSRSARTRFENHYSSAINCYKNGEYTLAMQYLGRALHYIEDIGTTPHSAGITYDTYGVLQVFLNPHKKYESWVKDHYEDYPEFESQSSSKYDYVLNNSFETIINDLAEISSSYKGEVDNCRELTLTCFTTGYYDAAVNTIPLTQEIVAGILNRFYEDVTNNSSLNYIKDGATYFIKNKSGYYLDINETDGNFQLNSDQDCSNQEFKINLNNDGTFSLIIDSAIDKALTINTGTGDLELVEYTGSIEQKFKFTQLDNGYYRIMAGYYDGEGDFAYALGVDDSSINVGSDIKSLYYDPDSLGGNGQVWYLELHSHTYRMIRDNYISHNLICTTSGITLEPHEWYHNGIEYICSKCGMKKEDGPIVITSDENKIK